MMICKVCGLQFHTENPHAILKLVGDDVVVVTFCSVSCLGDWCKEIIAAIEAEE